MSKVLILNASKVFAHSYGKLNDYLTDIAKQTLEGLGIGMSPLPTFMCNDVMKAPEIDKDVERYTAHLKENFPLNPYKEPEPYGMGKDAYHHPGTPEGTLTACQLDDCSVYPGVKHRYWIYVPAQYQSTKPAVLMVFLDGLTYGFSSGGNAAFAVAWNRSDLFRKVISHCGSFANIRGGHLFPALVRLEEKKPLKVWLSSGEKDLDIVFGNWMVANQYMGTSLDYKGYDYQLHISKGGHNLKYGAFVFPDTMRWIWGSLDRNQK